MRPQFKSFAILFLFTLPSMTTGCGHAQQEAAIQDSLAEKKSADATFAASYRATVKLADEGWTQAFKSRQEFIDAQFTAWMVAQGYKASGSGKNLVIDPEPKVGFALLVPSILKRDQDIEALRLERDKWNAARDRIYAAIDEYQAISNANYETVADAYRARAEQRHVIETLMRTIGTAAVSIGSSVLIGG